MRLVLLVAAGVVTGVLVTVWRSRHGVEVWHVSDEQTRMTRQGP